MTEAKANITIICGSCHGLRPATLTFAETAKIHGVDVEDVYVYTCDDCGGYSATPQMSAPRIREAVHAAIARLTE